MEEDRACYTNMEAMMLSINEMMKTMGDRWAEDDNGRERCDFRGIDGPQGFRRKRTMPEQWQKLDVLIFHGKEAFWWLDRMEQYFTLWVIPEDGWLSVTTFTMEGRALTWFRWWEHTT